MTSTSDKRLEWQMPQHGSTKTIRCTRRNGHKPLQLTPIRYRQLKQAGLPVPVDLELAYLSLQSRHGWLEPSAIEAIEAEGKPPTNNIAEEEQDTEPYDDPNEWLYELMGCPSAPTVGGWIPVVPTPAVRRDRVTADPRFIDAEFDQAELDARSGGTGDHVQIHYV